MANKKKSTNISDVVNDLISHPSVESEPVTSTNTEPVSYVQPRITPTVTKTNEPQTVKRGYLLPVDVVERFRLCTYLHQDKSASAHVAQALTKYMDDLKIPTEMPLFKNSSQQ